MRRFPAIVAMVVLIGWSTGACGGGNQAGGGPGATGAGAQSPSPTASRSPGPGGSNIPTGAPPPSRVPATPPDIPFLTPGPDATPAGQVPTTVRWKGMVYYNETLDRPGGADFMQPDEHHDIQGQLVLDLKLDPTQSDAEKSVWVDDGGVWVFHGTGTSTLSDGCTNLGDTFSGTGAFAKWDPSVEGTGFVQLTIYNDPQARPRAQLAFSLTGHEARTGKVMSGPDCKPFQADSTWPFPTSMSGALLDGAVESQAGTLGVYLGTFAPATQGDWTTSWYGSLLEVK